MAYAYLTRIRLTGLQQYGWCGNTPAYCGTGCISGCSGQAVSSSATAASSTSSATTPRSDGGYSRKLRFSRKSNSTAGRCGVDFGGATCDPAGPYGGCCSSYG